LRSRGAGYELNGQRLLPGDKVVTRYPSGNRNAEVFDGPDAFDFARKPNPHIAFGGGNLQFSTE
jgi:cytochrome P450